MAFFHFLKIFIFGPVLAVLGHFGPGPKKKNFFFGFFFAYFSELNHSEQKKSEKNWSIVDHPWPRLRNFWAQKIEKNIFAFFCEICNSESEKFVMFCIHAATALLKTKVEPSAMSTLLLFVYPNRYLRM